MKKVLVLLTLTALFACAKKEEPKNDNFLGRTETAEQKSRINIIEGSGLTYFCIVEVDGHQYLANTNHGGIIHLESCPCKTK